MTLGRAFAVVVSLALVAGCTSDSTAGTPDADSSSDAVPAAELLPTCASPDGAPVGAKSAKDVNKLVDALDLPAWDAADIGASARLPDGRIVWVFGDTLREDMTPGIVANSMLISSESCISQVIPEGSGPVIPDVDSKTVYWPMSVVAARVGQEDFVVVMAGRTRRGDSGGSLDFGFVGLSVAVFVVAEDGVPDLRSVTPITEDDPDPYAVDWGAASFIDGRWGYVYGTRLTGEDLVFGRELYVARVPVASPSDRSTWRFWDSSAWQRDPDRAVAVVPADGGVSQTLSVQKLGPSEYVAVSKRDDFLGDFVYTWKAKTPQGPFTAYQGVKAPSNLDEGLLAYDPLAHPEVTLQNGKLLVSVSRNTTDFARLVEDPTLGIPNFVEVSVP